MTTNLYPLSIALQFFFFVIRSAAISSNATSDVSINCGSTGTSAARGGSEWIGDVLPEYPSLLQVKGSSTISTVVGKLIYAADPVPYKRARISQSQFVYALKVRPGQKIIRLHFNPTSYRGFQGRKDLFTVKAGPFTLLSNFSASLTGDALGVSFFAKEFSLNIPKYQFINIIFSPESSESFDTYAFVNGIEIFSISFSFPYFQGGYYGSVASAHNILHQEEVSQNSVLFVGASDEVYLKCFIPKPGGQEAELTRFANYNSRKMLVGVGFEYFIRAHFSELGLKIAGAGDIMFKVLINEMVADTNIRVVRRSDEDDIPWHSDYMVMVRGNTEEGKRDMSISLQSYDDLIDAHELASPNPWPPARDPTTESFLVHPPIWMNAFFIIAITIFFGGIIFVSKLWKAWEASITEKKAKPKPKTETETETFEKKLRRKLSSRVEWSQETWKADNTEKEIKSKTSSTIHLEWEETWEDTATEKKAKVVERLQKTQVDITEKNNKSKTSSRIQKKLWENWEAISSEEENKPKSSSRAERLCRRFSLDEIQVATNNFSDALLIGRGGYGNVYKGHIDEEQYPVAVKRLKSSSNQGESEFLTEIEMLSELRHVNLVSLIGYCSENKEMIIVYEYIPCGTLADHLYKLAMESNSCSPLTWKQRLDICIGAGRGIDYLHTGCGVIHRDVKASNILLDENLIAKVSDFGLAKHENRSTLQSHVSTVVKGTIGYLDPSYFYTGKLTRKSDTYGFGVVLLEVLCGRPALDSTVAEDERALTMWARDKIHKGEVEQIISKSLRGEISPNSLKTFLGVAERCLNDEPEKRPTMSEVVLQLELAVEQQETEHVLVLNKVARVSDDNHHSDERVVDDPLFTETVNYVVADPLFIGTKENEGQKEIISHERKLEVATEMLWHNKAYLKECILFCSVFPSDYEFTKDTLVWQWITGSLLDLSEDEIEEVYIQCFDTLLNLDYIVPSGYDHLADEIKYKIGNKMTMSLQNQLLEPKFQNNLEGKQTDTVKVEHLSLAFMKIDLINFGIVKQCCRLQTLFIHRCYSSKVNYLPPDIFLELKALKILNLSHTNIKELPSSVENLTEVRYLDISETPIKWLPESMRCCSHLQTLKLDGCLSLVGLPKCTSKLINLRHLVLDIPRQLQSMPTGIGELSKLLTLKAFLVGEDEGARIGELKNMNSLRGSLRLLNLENVLTKEEAAKACLCNKHGLKKIELQWSDLRDDKNTDEEEILNSLQPPVGIQELKIIFYSGGVLSSWISDPSFSELVNITLYRCRYCEILPSLGELPSLKILYVIENNIAKEINGFFCRKGSNEHHVAFPKLEKLSFDSMSELQQWTGLKKGDFPRLDCLIIQYCPKLIGVSFVSHLSSLSHLEISYCSEISCLPEAGLPPTLESLMIKDCPKLKERCCNEQCQDWSKVARVPAFYIDNEKVSL